MEPQELDRVHADIDRCVVCSGLPGLKKPTPLARGAGGPLVVVGEAPGNTEVSSGKAFSGSGGRRLFEWLAKCGIERPRDAVYLTAAVKCVPGDRAQLPRMADRCRRFLHRQLAAIQPTLVITLGGLAYSELAFDSTPFGDAVCRARDSRDCLLVPTDGCHYVLLPWPHPSGRSLWLNEKEHRMLLESSFDVVAGLINAGASHE